MARMSPAAKVARVVQAKRAWEMHAPGYIFWGMALRQFAVEVQPSLDADADVTSLRAALRIALARRRVAHAKALRLIHNVALSVKGHPDFGENCQLLEDLGYTRDDVIRRKLRKKRRKRGKSTK